MKDMKGLKVKKMKLFQWWGQAFLIVVIGFYDSWFKKRGQMSGGSMVDGSWGIGIGGLP